MKTSVANRSSVGIWMEWIVSIWWFFFKFCLLADSNCEPMFGPTQKGEGRGVTRTHIYPRSARWCDLVWLNWIAKHEVHQWDQYRGAWCLKNLWDPPKTCARSPKLLACSQHVCSIVPVLYSIVRIILGHKTHDYKREGRKYCVQCTNGTYTSNKYSEYCTTSDQYGVLVGVLSTPFHWGACFGKSDEEPCWL